MTLLHGGLLAAGVAAAAIPILIHLLFRRRRPPVEWAAMEILLEAIRNQARRLRLEQWLLLAARCFVFMLAGLALARPMLEGSSFLRGASRRTVVLVLDDGAAGAVTTKVGDPASSAFARTREDAVELVRKLEPGDSVGVVLAAKPVRAALLPPSTDLDSVARFIGSLERSDGATDLAGALALVAAERSRDPQSDLVAIVMSEFRAGSLDLASPPPATLAPPTRAGAPAEGVRILASAPASDTPEDIAVAAVDPESAIDDEGATVAVRIAREGGSNASRSVRVALSADGAMPEAARTVRLEAGQSGATTDFAVRPARTAARVGNGGIAVEIDPDAQPLNDRRFAVHESRHGLRVGVVARRTFESADIGDVPAARWITRALAPVDRPGLELVEIEPAALDARAIQDVDAVFVPRPDALAVGGWSVLREFVDRGGLVAVMPAGDLDAQRWTEAFTAAFSLPWQISPEAPPLESPLGFAVEQPERRMFGAVGAELPELLRPIEISRRVEVRGAATDSVLVLADGSPFLAIAAPPATEGSPSRGLVALVTAAPELAWTNLPVKPFIVPFVQELVRRSLAEIGGRDRVEVGDRPRVAQRDAAELRSPTGVSVPLDRSGIAAEPLAEPGVWTVLNRLGQPIGGIAVNVALPATRAEPQRGEAIAAWLDAAAPVTVSAPSEMVRSLRPARDSKGLAIWLLGVVAALILVETALARWFSHAGAARGGHGDPGVTGTASVAGAARSDAAAAEMGARSA